MNLDKFQPYALALLRIIVAWIRPLVSLEALCPWNPSLGWAASSSW